MEKRKSFAPIAIIGVGVIFPGSKEASAFWKHIVNGSDLITDVPKTHWLIEDYYDPDPHIPDKTYCKRGAFIPDISFNPIEYGIPPANVSQTDATQLLSLVVAKQVLTDVFGQDFEKIADLSAASIILGITSAQALVSYASSRLQHPIWRKALREHGIPQDIEEKICQTMSHSYVPWNESMFPGLLGNVVSGRIANRFNFGGTNCVTDAACASSMAALSMAIDELHLGRADLVVSGGADMLNDIFMYMCFSKTPSLSKTGDCRPFAKSADGTLLGEGIAFFALKRLHDAEQDGNAIYAVIRGIGSSSDGRSKSIYAPIAKGQSKAIERCYAAANFAPRTVELLEGHGTGTIAGDAAEIDGLKIGFSSGENITEPWCALGSIKSQIGHTKAAAGAASLFKTVMAVLHKVLPPTIKIDAPNPAVEDHSPFYLNTETRPWVKKSNHPRRAGISSFGFGGTNFHMVIEEYNGPYKVAARLRTFPSELVLLSGESSNNIIALSQQIIKETQENNTLIYLSKTSQEKFSHLHAVRLAIIAMDEKDLIAKLQQASQLIKQNPLSSINTKNIYYSSRKNSFNNKVAFVFPGKNSEYLGMGSDLYMAFNTIQTTWDKINCMSLDPVNSLHEIVFPMPVFNNHTKEKNKERLAKPRFAFPALATTSIAQFNLLKELKIEANYYAGNQIGELVALYAQDALDLSSVMQIAEEIGKEKTTLSFNGKFCANISEEIKKQLEKSFLQPSHFTEQIEAIYQKDVRVFIEVGAERLLTNQIEKILNGREACIVHLDEKNQNGITSLWNALGQLAVYGLNIHFDALWKNYRIPEKAQTKKEFTLNLNGAPYGKPYPPKRGAKDLPQPNQIGSIPNWIHYQTIQPEKKLEMESVALSTPTKRAASSSVTESYFSPKIERRNSMPLTTDHPAQLATETVSVARIDKILILYQKLQEDIAKAHHEYQLQIEKSHLAYIEEVHSMLDNLQKLAINDGAAISPTTLLQNIHPPKIENISIPIQKMEAPPVFHVASNIEIQKSTVQPVPFAQPTSQPEIDPKMQKILLEIVAEKTGYPEDTLKPEMDLEADLGIDSIKRVEILSAMQEKVPNLPELKPAEMATLRTLNEILAYIKKQLGG